MVLVTFDIPRAELIFAMNSEYSPVIRVSDLDGNLLALTGSLGLIIYATRMAEMSHGLGVRGEYISLSLKYQNEVKSFENFLDPKFDFVGSYCSLLTR